MDKLERKIEAHVRDYARSRGVLCYKFVSPGNNGVPDRIFVYKGKTHYVEFKRWGAECTTVQKMQHRKLKEHGCVVVIIDDIVKGEKFIDDLVNAELK